jgi:hypothetical protein
MTEELGHKFNKQQSIANPALGTQFLEEVISLSSNLELCFSYCLHSLQHFFSKHYKIYLSFFFYCICFRLLGIIAPTILKRLRWHWKNCNSLPLPLSSQSIKSVGLSGGTVEVSIVKLSGFPKVLQARTSWNLGSIKQRSGQGYVYHIFFTSLSILHFVPTFMFALNFFTARGCCGQGVTGYTKCIGWTGRRRGSWFVAGLLGEVANLPLG